MSISSVDVTCDGCLVIETAPWKAAPQIEGGITAYLRSFGWTADTRLGKHYCPTCAKARRKRQRQINNGENNA